MASAYIKDESGNDQLLLAPLRRDPARYLAHTGSNLNLT